MDYLELPVSSDPYQVMYLSIAPDGNAFLARVELRFLPATGRWFFSISDAMTGESYVNQIPVVCSHGVLNDLMAPFRWRFQGAGLGSIFCLKAVEHPGSPDPGEDNLGEFRLIWGDRWKEGED